MNQHTAALITFGLGGHMVYFAPQEGYGQCTLSGYDSPSSFWRERPNEIIPDGTPVLDKRGVLSVNPQFSYASPLVDTRVQTGNVSRLGPVDPLFASAVADNQFGTLLRVHEAAMASMEELKAASAILDRLPPGPLDSIGVDDYVAWWRARGARFGRTLAGAFVWVE